MIIPTAIVAMILFIWMNNTVQRRRDKRDERREQIREKTDNLLKTLKNKPTQNIDNT